MQNTTKKKRGAVISAIVVIGFLLLYIGSLFFAMLTDMEWGAAAILGLYGLVILAVIGGVLLALRQRLREINKGEEADAEQY